MFDIKKTYDRLNKNYEKEIFIMQIVNVKAYWYMVHEWLVNFYQFLFSVPI